jgi:pentatricopeptide repeat protein
MSTLWPPVQLTRYSTASYRLQSSITRLSLVRSHIAQGKYHRTLYTITGTTACRRFWTSILPLRPITHNSHKHVDVLLLGAKSFSCSAVQYQSGKSSRETVKKGLIRRVRRKSGTSKQAKRKTKATGKSKKKASKVSAKDKQKTPKKSEQKTSKSAKAEHSGLQILELQPAKTSALWASSIVKLARHPERLSAVRSLVQLLRENIECETTNETSISSIKKVQIKYDLKNISSNLSPDILTNSEEVIKSIQKIKTSEKDLDHLSRRRLKKLRRTLLESFVDVAELWKHYLRVRDTPELLKHVPLLLFRLTRNVIIRCMHELGMKEVARRVVIVFEDQRRALGVESTEDDATYLWALGELGLYNKVISEFENIAHCGRQFGKVVPDEQLWHFYIIALARTGAIKQAMNAVKDVKRYFKHFPSGYAVAILLSHIIRSGDVDRALRLLGMPSRASQHMLVERSEKIRLDLADSVSGHNIILADLAVMGDSESAQRLVDLMQKRSIPVMQFAVTALLDLMVRKEKLSLGAIRELYNKMCNFDYKLDIVSHSAFLHHLLRAGDPDAIHIIMDRLRQDGIPPNVYTYTIMIRYTSRQENMSSAETIFEHMKANNITPTAVTYGAMIDGYARHRNIQGVENMINEFKKTGHPIELTMWNTILSAFARLGNLKKTLYIFDLMRQDNRKPDRYTYWWLFYAYRWCRLTPELEAAISPYLSDCLRTPPKNRSDDMYEVNVDQIDALYQDDIPDFKQMSTNNDDWKYYAPVDTEFILAPPVLQIPSLLVKEMSVNHLRINRKFEELRTAVFDRVNALYQVQRKMSESMQ